MMNVSDFSDLYLNEDDGYIKAGDCMMFYSVNACSQSKGLLNFLLIGSQEWDVGVILSSWLGS